MSLNRLRPLRREDGRVGPLERLFGREVEGSLGLWPRMRVGPVFVFEGEQRVGGAFSDFGLTGGLLVGFGECWLSFLRLQL